MDLTIVTLDIINAIIDYDYYDSLTSWEISKKAGSNEKLNKLREKSGEHVAKLFPDTKFHDGKGQLLPLVKLKGIVEKKIEPLSKKEVEEYVDILKKDAKKIAKLYKEALK